MKKRIHTAVALLLAALMIAGAVPAFAVTNQIIGSGPSGSSGSAGGQQLLYRAVNGRKIEQPGAGDYFSAPFSLYVNAPQGHSIYTYDYWETNDYNRIGSAFHGSRVTVVAEHGGFYCMLYRLESFELRAGWVRTEMLSSWYPGDVLTYGNSSDSRSTAVLEEPGQGWSREYFVGTRRKFTELDETLSNVVSFTLDYQVTARNGSDTRDVTGPRDIYINEGDGWQYITTFEYNQFTPTHIVLHFSRPIRLAAVATVPNCADPDTFLFRQSVMDVVYTY